MHIYVDDRYQLIIYEIAMHVLILLLTSVQ